MRLPNKTLECKLFVDNYRYIIAVDEVGVGCLAGPVVVCAVLFDKKFFETRYKNLAGIRDSKLLSAKQREDFVEKLLQIKNFKFQISYCYPKTIDKINIYQATRLAMRRALTKLIDRSSLGKSAIRPTLDPRLFAREFSSGRIADLLQVIVLIDGKTKIKGLGLEQQAIVKGDSKVFSIACASILAKVCRDKLMVNYAKKFPNYGFEKHKGYGTKKHQAQLAKLGPCPIHRKSFAPVAKLI